MKFDSGTLQLHPHGGQITSRKHWWKIQDWTTGTLTRAKKFLTERNFAFDKSLPRDHILYYCSRAQRGMESYHKYSLKELQIFCKQRDLHVSEERNYTRQVVQEKLKVKELRDLLEYSDEEKRFPRFLELPAELRVMVYKFSFEMLDTVVRNYGWREETLNLEPSPLANVSKLLRMESLPLLYESAVLRVDMMRDHGYRESRNATEFFGVAPMAMIEAVKCIRIVISRGYQDRKTLYLWNLKFPDRAQLPDQFSLQHKFVGKRQSMLSVDGCEELTRALQRKVVDAMKPKEGAVMAKLRRADIYLIRKAVQDELL